MTSTRSADLRQFIQGSPPAGWKGRCSTSARWPSGNRSALVLMTRTFGVRQHPLGVARDVALDARPRPSLTSSRRGERLDQREGLHLGAVLDRPEAARVDEDAQAAHLGPARWPWPGPSGESARRFWTSCSCSTAGCSVQQPAADGLVVQRAACPSGAPSQSRVTYVDGSSTARSPRRSARITISTTAASALPAKTWSGPLVMTRQSRLTRVGAPGGSRDRRRVEPRLAARAAAG